MLLIIQILSEPPTNLELPDLSTPQPNWGEHQVKGVGRPILKPDVAERKPANFDNRSPTKTNSETDENAP